MLNSKRLERDDARWTQDRPRRKIDRLTASHEVDYPTTYLDVISTPSHCGADVTYITMQYTDLSIIRHLSFSM